MEQGKTKIQSNRMHLFRQITGALLWAFFFALAPLEILFWGALVWVPLLIWRERARATRYGNLPGLVIRLLTVSVVITAAALAPFKHEDRKVGPLPNAEISLGELAKARVIYPPHNQQNQVIRVLLPSTLPTRREVMQAITKQTGFKTSILHCGNGATVLFGSGGGLISGQDRETLSKN
jgi:hypothetical protein